MDLLVLPEGTLPFDLEEPRGRELADSLRALASDLRAPLVFGALGTGPGGPGEPGPTNSVYLFSPGHRELQRYDKAMLVPGMEAGAYRRGVVGATLSTGSLVLGPLLCYESLFQRAARKSRNDGAILLVNLSSDIWFGGVGTPLGSIFLSQHPAHLVLRAVETRTSTARAANGGFSFVLDPVGRIVSRTVPPEGGVTEARAPVYRGATLFARTGDWLGPGSVLACLALVLGLRRRRGQEGPRRRRGPEGRCVANH